MTVLVPTYNFRRLTYRGQIAFLAREVGAALGYDQGGRRFVGQMTKEWKKEIREGEHWYRVSGSDLKALKAQGGAAAAAQDGPASSPSPLPVLADGPEAGPLSPGRGRRPGPSGAEDLDDGPAPGPSRAAAAAAFLFAHESILLTEALFRSGRPFAFNLWTWFVAEVAPSPAAADVDALMAAVRSLAAAKGIPLKSDPNELLAAFRTSLAEHGEVLLVDGMLEPTFTPKVADLDGDRGLFALADRAAAPGRPS